MLPLKGQRQGHSTFGLRFSSQMHTMGPQCITNGKCIRRDDARCSSFLCTRFPITTSRTWLKRYSLLSDYKYCLQWKIIKFINEYNLPLYMSMFNYYWMFVSNMSSVYVTKSVAVFSVVEVSIPLFANIEDRHVFRLFLFDGLLKCRLFEVSTRRQNTFVFRFNDNIKVYGGSSNGGTATVSHFKYCGVNIVFFRSGALESCKSKIYKDNKNYRKLAMYL